MRKSSGLANKYRTRRSTYSVKGKSSRADKYGQWNQGKQIRTDSIAGRVLSYDATTGEWNRATSSNA